MQRQKVLKKAVQRRLNAQELDKDRRAQARRVYSGCAAACLDSNEYRKRYKRESETVFQQGYFQADSHEQGAQEAPKSTHDHQFRYTTKYPTLGELTDGGDSLAARVNPAC